MILKPLLHFNYAIKLPKDIPCLFKKRFKTIRCLSTKEIPSKDNGTAHNRTIRTIKTLKNVRYAQLRDCQILSKTDNRDFVANIEISKHLTQVQYLSLTDTISLTKPVPHIRIWLKYAKLLKKITYAIKDSSDSQVQRGVNHPYEKQIKRVMKLFTRMKITELNLHSNLFSQDDSVFLFQKYPSSLKCLSLSCYEDQIRMPDAPIQGDNSFENLTNLKAICVDIQYGMTVPLLNSIQDLSSLTILDLKGNFASERPDLTPLLTKLQKYRRLKVLRLNFSNNTEDLQEIFEAVDACPITEFAWTGRVDNENLLVPLCKFISGRTELESLGIYVRKAYPIIISSDLISAIKKTLTKPIPLKYLRISYDVEGDHTVYREIIHGLANAGRSLRELRLNFGSLNVNENEWQELVDFMGKLEDIETLGLSVNIPRDEFQKAADLVCKWKNIKVLGFGSLDGNEVGYLKNYMRILTKRGIEKFYCPIKWDEHRKLKGIELADMDLVYSSNPYFEELRCWL